MAPWQPVWVGDSAAVCKAGGGRGVVCLVTELLEGEIDYILGRMGRLPGGEMYPRQNPEVIEQITRVMEALAYREGRQGGYQAGYQAGYQEGYQAAMKEMTEAASQKNAALESQSSPSPTEGGTQRRTQPRASSNLETVLLDIRAHPGSRGIEIVDRLKDRVCERTVRPAIHRLRSKKLITQSGKKWYPSEMLEIVEFQEGSSVV